MKTIILILALLIPTFAMAGVAQIVVPVTFTYQGKSVTVRMAIDTGASVTTIDTSVADQLGIPTTCTNTGYAQMADGSPVKFCTETLGIAASTLSRTMPINIMDYSANREAQGMLGLDFLSALTMTLDWRNRRVYWSE